MEIFTKKPRDRAILLRYVMYLQKLFYISRMIKKLRVLVQIKEYAVGIKFWLPLHSNTNLLLATLWYFIFSDKWLKITHKEQKTLVVCLVYEYIFWMLKIINS